MQTAGEVLDEFIHTANLSVEKHWLKILVSYSVGYLVLLSYLGSFQPMISWDGFFYIRYTMDSVFPPGYPLLIFLLESITRDGAVAATWVSMLCMCGTVFMLYRLAVQFVSPLWALFATVLVSINPLSLKLGVVTYSEATYVFFLVLSLYFFSLTFIKHGAIKHFVFSGIAGGAAMITRPEAIVFFLALLLVYVLRKKNLRPLFFLSGSFATIVLLSTTVTYFYTGEFTLTKKTANIRVAYPTHEWQENESLKTGTTQSASTAELVRSALTNYPENLWAETSHLLAFAGIPLLAVALFGIATKRTYMLAGLVQFFVYPFFSGLGAAWRFVFPYLPILIVFAVLALETRMKGIPRFVVFVAVLFSSIGAYSFAVEADEPFVELKQAGLALRSYVNDETILIDKKPHSAFYAGLKPSQYIETPMLNSEELYAFAKQRRATLLLASRQLTFIFRDQQMSLFDPVKRTQWADKFKPLLTLNEGESNEVIVFQIL